MNINGLCRASGGLPVTAEGVGAKSEELPTVFRATKDIRNKYSLAHPAWDIGELDGLAELIRDERRS